MYREFIFSLVKKGQWAREAQRDHLVLLGHQEKLGLRVSLVLQVQEDNRDHQDHLELWYNFLPSIRLIYKLQKY